MDLDFSNCSVLIVGDVILDKYYYGKVNRISPEAPVPVVKVIREKHSPGGSGNVVSNISGLGAKAFHISLAGRDQNAIILKKLLDNPDIKNKFIITDKPTVTKIRVIGEHQQVVRLDFEEKNRIGRAIAGKIIQAVDSMIGRTGAAVISDYGKGICTPEVCQHIINAAGRKSIPVIVDPKGYDWAKYKNADIITPNVKELGEAAGIEIWNEDREIEKYGSGIMKKYSIKNILVTRSDRGMTLITKDMCRHIPTHAQEVFDVSGAGDTVVAALAAGLAGNLSMMESADIANRAAGIVVGKFGTASVELDELIQSFHTGHTIYPKILTMQLLKNIAEQLTGKGKKITFPVIESYNDINIKIINFLNNIKKKSDYLIVGINNTANGKPGFSDIIASLECVDYVVLLEGKNPPVEIKNNKNIRIILQR